MTLSFQERTLLGKGKAIYLIQSVDSENQSFYMYIKLDRKGAEAMHHSFARQEPLTFEDYGEIVDSGWGKPEKHPDVERLN